ncbi:MAG TPA: glucose 1-dehydrogenase [Thermomicrobiales bacterium]|nr:glucose 1-dehydrogenase [Thermomicrobiales bacterium]
MTDTAGVTATAVQPGIAIHPGQANSLHLTEIPREEPGAGEVLIRVRQVGICGTDRELIHGSFGTAPIGEASLVLGHEMFGEVKAVGPDVVDFTPGQLVTATVRRPDGCPACKAGQPDMCQWLGYTERGISGLHGYMTESVVEDVGWVIGVPHELAHVGILLEPLSVVEKALRQANLIQRRIRSWNPQTALVLGAGPIGLLGTFLLRSRGMEVVTMARRPGPHLVSEIVEAAGARYAGMQETSIRDVAAQLPPIDLIFEATGSAEPGFAAMEVLGNNGVLILLSGTGRPAELTVPAAAINGSLLRGNKVVVGSVNSAREDFELGVEDLSRFENLWPGLASRLITRHLDGLDDYARILDKPDGDIKTVIDVDEGFRVTG